MTARRARSSDTTNQALPVNGDRHLGIACCLQDEPERREFVAAIERDEMRLMSVASVLEAAMVLGGRRGAAALPSIDLFISLADIQLVPFDLEQLAAARDAFRRYGKGRNSANLTFGDCMSYALAKVKGEPLLFKGTDFPLTDVRAVGV